MGPKPLLEIVATNMPDELCYMDLLVDPSRIFLGDSYDEDKQYNGFDTEMISKLLDNKYNLVPKVLTGIGIPIFGGITCDVRDGLCQMKYSYTGIPDQFRIIVVTKSNQVVISNVINRKAFDTTVYFDFKTGIAHEKSIVSLYFHQSIDTFIPTIVIEGIVLLFAGYSFKRNYIPFILVNLLTQVILTLTVGRTMISHGMFDAFIIYFLVEILIIIVEGILYSKYLKFSVIDPVTNIISISHQNKSTAVVYTLIANISSFLYGIWFIAN